MVPRWRLEEAQGAMRALKNDHAKKMRTYKKLTRFYESCLANLKSKVTPGGCEGDKLSEANREIERLKKELATFRELHEVEEDGAGGKRKRKKSSESEEGGTVARLPTEVWTMVAAKLYDDDVLAFALTSKQHRQAQQQAGRKLVTRPCYENEDGSHTVKYHSRDWCAWWSRRFNISETNEKCMNRVIRIAACFGYLDVLKTYWSDIPEDKIPLLMDKWASAFAPSNGHLETLQWLRRQGCPWDEDTCGCAALHGRLECLQWARENGCPWSADEMCDDAAKHGHLAVLKWVRGQGCPWSEATTLKAAMKGHLKCFRWLIYQGCPWNRESCLSSGNAKFKQWMQDQENLE